MIFPIDIQSKVKNAREMKGNNRVQLFITLFVLFNIVMYFVASFFLSAMFGSSKLTIPFLLLCDMIFGVLIFRFIVFDETGKRIEYENRENDSFARYVFLRDAENEDSNVFEYVNGSAMCILQFKFGSTSKNKIKGCEELLTKISSESLKLGFSVQHIVMSENFENSEEFKNHISEVNKSNSEITTIEMTDALIEESKKSSNVNTIYLILRTRTNYQQDELVSLMRAIVSLSKSNFTSFRSVKFLTMQDLLEMSRDFYEVVAIDLSLMRAIDRSADLIAEMQNVVSVYSLSGRSGKTYNSSFSKTIFEQEEKTIV